MQLFFALMPPQELANRLAPIMGGIAGARWQDAGQLHLTLRYVGEVTPVIAEELAASFGRSALSVPPITLAGTGAFASAGRPHALWLRALPVDALTRAHKKLDRMCQMIGLAPEKRAFLPHVTVARLPRTSGPVDNWLAAHSGRTFEPIGFQRCALLESVPHDAGRAYLELTSIPIT